jgi:rubrerythrin
MDTLKRKIKKDIAGEAKAIKDYKKRASTKGLSQKDKSTILEIRRDEKDHHRLLKGILKKIKE